MPTSKFSLCERFYMYNMYIKGRKLCAKARLKFQIKFPNRPVPSPETIRRLAKRFKGTGSVNNRKSNRKWSVPTEEKLDQTGERLELCSFSDLSITSPTSQLILQPFCRFTYVIAHSPTLPLLHLRRNSFSNPSFVFTTSQALHLRHLKSRAHSPTFPSLHLLHNSFSNPSVASPTS